jgi:hypothetical protein
VHPARRLRSNTDEIARFLYIASALRQYGNARSCRTRVRQGASATLVVTGANTVRFLPTSADRERVSNPHFVGKTTPSDMCRHPETT